MNTNIPYIITDKNVSLQLDGKPHIISRSTGIYDRVIDAIRGGDVEELRNLMKPKERIANATEGRISFDGRDLRFNGDIIHNAIKDRLHYLWDQGIDYAPLMRFLDNLMDNPSYRAKNETYRFLEACNLPITNDGHFLAYKMVRENYFDIFSGTMDNSIGQEVKVRRNEVDEDSNRTCSRGLHACSQEYLGKYGRRNNSDRIMVVKINPRDVVAVPKDYNNAKMRVCHYKVVDELSWDDVRIDTFHTDNYSGMDYSDNYLTTPSDLDEVDDDDMFDDDPFDDLDVESELPVVKSTTTATTYNGAAKAKLTERQVQDIKRMLASRDYTYVGIAALYDVDESTIRKINKGDIWKNVTI